MSLYVRFLGIYDLLKSSLVERVVHRGCFGFTLSQLPNGVVFNGLECTVDFHRRSKQEDIFEESHQPFRAIGGLESTKELRIILIYFILIYFLIHSIRGGFTLPLPPPLDLF